MKRLSLLFLCIFAVLSCTDTTPVAGGPAFRGVNLSGAESGPSTLPGVEGSNYIWTTPAQIDYYNSKNMNIYRVNFLWERLQPTAKGNLDLNYLTKLKSTVNYATGKGKYVILNPHNFARYYNNIVGSAAVPNDVFADFWRRVAIEFRDNPNVIFGLTNEPHDVSTVAWRLAAQDAINAIRSAGSVNLISVPGNGWTGMHSWDATWVDTATPKVSNATELLKLTDPQNMYVFEVHQYFDADYSGSYTSGDCVSASIGVDKAKPFVAWLRANNKKAIVAEIAGPNTATCKAAMDNFLTYVNANSDVLVGWLWWNSIKDGFWGGAKGYMPNLDVKSGVEDPRMAWLTPYLSIPDAGAPVDSGVKDASPVVDAGGTTTCAMTNNPPTWFPTNKGYFSRVNGSVSYTGYVPASYKSSTPAMLVVGLHGCGDNAQNFGYWAVNPSDGVNSQKHIGISIGGKDGACWDLTNDVSKVTAAIADVSTCFNIDPQKIVIGGYSSGGELAYKIGFTQSNKFAGILVENASMTQGTTPTTASWKINVAHIAHVGDTIFPIAKVRADWAKIEAFGIPLQKSEVAGDHNGTSADWLNYLLPKIATWKSPGPIINDAGAPDASPIDAGVADAGKVDSGVANDAGVDGGVDSGIKDAGVDTGIVDAGVDSGKPDAGSVDAGVPDAGVVAVLKPVVRITYNWVSGYCEEVDLVNKESKPLTWNQISINMRGGTVRDQSKKGPPWDTWNASFSARTGVVLVKPATWNKSVPANSKVTFGFCADFATSGTKWTGTIVDGSLK
jgi:endoglucanase